MCTKVFTWTFRLQFSYCIPTLRPKTSVKTRGGIVISQYLCMFVKSLEKIFLTSEKSDIFCRLVNIRVHKRSKKLFPGMLLLQDGS